MSQQNDFDRISREVLAIDPTAIEQPFSGSMASVVSTRFFNLSGQSLDQLTKGINIVRETLSNGTTRTRKVVVK